MLENPIFFYIASAIIIFFTIISLINKNIINSLLAAVMVFFCGALFFYLLGSEYNAIIQAAVYGVAVPVIIGLSIMFSGNVSCKNSTETENKREFKLSYFTLLSGGIFVLALVYVIMISVSILPDTFCIKEIAQTTSYDVISAFARGIFIDYVWAFELLSLLLTIVIAGFTLFNRRRDS